MPKSITSMLPYGCNWTTFRPDLNQAICDAGYTFPKLLQICFHMASFGHVFVQIWVKPFSNPDTPSHGYCGSAPIWLNLDTFLSRSGASNFLSPGAHSQIHYNLAPIWFHLDTFLSRSGSSNFRTRIHLPETIADLLPYGFIWTPFCPDLDQAIFKPRYTFPKLLQICFSTCVFSNSICTFYTSVDLGFLSCRSGSTQKCFIAFEKCTDGGFSHYSICTFYTSADLGFLSCRSGNTQNCFIAFEKCTDGGFSHYSICTFYTSVDLGFLSCRSGNT